MRQFENSADLDSFIKELEEESQTKFITFSVDRHYNDKDWHPLPGNRVYWQWAGGSGMPAIEFTGVPFMFVGSKRLVCHQGKDLAVAQKQRYAEEKAKKTMMDHTLVRNKSNSQSTKKVGCPAAISISKIATFPKFKLEEDRERSKKAASKMLREALERDPVVWGTCYVVTQPSAHAGHAMGEMEPVDARVEQQVVELRKQGVRKVSELKRHLAQFVTAELFKGASPPPASRRRYYPSEKDLRNIMAKVKDQARHRIDQVNLKGLFEEWCAATPEDKFHLRLRTEDASFLFCHQTLWQMRLLRLYGADVCVFDAAYRTIRYPLPLCFLCVRTNVCYSVVGVMVLQEETTEAIKEGLEVFKCWNADWRPASFMVDCNAAEIQAVESVFEGTKALLSDFHREKAWDEWIQKEHRVADKGDALTKLKAIASSLTTEQYEEAVKALMASHTWEQNPAFQSWFSDTWLSKAKRWVSAFKEETLNIAIITNHETEHQNKLFKHQYLEDYRDRTLSEMLDIVTHVYIPELRRTYIEANVRSYRQYDSSVPPFLWDRPADVIQHITSCMDSSLSEGHVVKLGDGVFRVKSETQEDQSYELAFGSDDSLPSCQCDDWRRYKLPCKHFCAVFQKVPGWTWQQLSLKYREHPLLNLDATCCSMTPDSVDEWGTEVVSEPVTCKDTQVTSDCDSPPRKRVSKSYLRKKCVNLTKQLMDRIYTTESQDTLEELSETLGRLVKGLTPVFGSEDGMLHLEAKRVRVSSCTD
ncbi:uncharacterized protein si:dkey-31c13.1 isoform X1 [Pelmatolapia mariae]|uniref:uncharacterized protein si:dkey-31c13.1 isoform X1 n=2 Tax=Pelmatolapia mariae TaxID=158779 RepID=UPI002FE68B16